MLDERRHVRARDDAVAGADRHHLEPVEEVFAKRAGRDALAEIAMRRRDDAHVDRPLLVRADGADGSALENVEQLRLERRRHLADLVEEERAAAGLFEQARWIRVAPVNAPLT